MKIKFLNTYQVKSAGGKLYLEGDVVDLPDSSANHFLKRGAAELFVDPALPEAPPAATQPAPKKKAAADVPPDKDVGGKTDPVKAFTAAQAQFVEKELAAILEPAAKQEADT